LLVSPASRRLVHILNATAIDEQLDSLQNRVERTLGQRAGSPLVELQRSGTFLRRLEPPSCFASLSMLHLSPLSLKLKVECANGDPGADGAGRRRRGSWC